MPYFQYPDEFPLSSLPPLIRDAVIEAQQITQAPLGLVAASALGAVSLVCQNLIDVCRLNTLRGPVSLFLLTLAESAERKGQASRIAATIRHNRARGKHQITSMSDIVRDLSRLGWTDERIGTELGMDQDEVLRLKQISGLTELFQEDNFSPSWTVR